MVEPVTTFYRDLVPLLADAGYEIELVLSGAEYRSAREPLEDVFAGRNVKVTHLHPFSRQMPTAPKKKLWVMIAYIAQSVLLSMKSPVDANFFLTQPPLFGLWGRALKALKEQPYICLIMDLYPDIAILDGMLEENSKFAGVMSRLAMKALQAASKVVVIGRCMEDLLVKRGLARERICVIRNWANEQLIYPVPREQNRLRNELNLQDQFVVLYSGNMGVSHYFDDILEVAGRLKHNKEICFVFIGNGRRRKQLEKAKSDKCIDNILLLPFQPFERLPQSLSLGDIHFISLRAGFEGRVVPSKAYSPMAAGRPIVYQGAPSGEIARMVREEGIGAVVEPGAVDQLERVIMDYFENPAKVAAQGNLAWQLSHGRYSHQWALESYCRVIEDLFA